MFRRSTRGRRSPTHQEGVLTETCPKCGSSEVLGDYCQRCRVKVSQYQAYLATLGQGARRALAKKRRWFVFKSPVAPPANWKASYEDGILKKIYRELRYPATTRGVYLVLLALHLNAAGRTVSLEVSVDPPNPEVAQSVRTAVSQAQPFPPPRGGVRDGEDQSVSLALTVSV